MRDYVYCIAPSARAPLITAYGRMLIFEHVIAYVDRIMALARGGLNPVLHTYHDSLRLFFMGSQFVAVLRDTATADAILAGGGSIPVPLAMPGEAPPPPMPVRRAGPPTTNLPNNNGSGAGNNSNNVNNGLPPSLASVHPINGTNVDRAIACLERVSWTLSAYGARWEDAEQLATGFKTISRSVLESLWARQATQSKQPPKSTAPPVPSLVSHQQQQRQPHPHPHYQQQAYQPQLVQQQQQQQQVHYQIPQYQQMPPQQQHQQPPPPHMQYQPQQPRQPAGLVPMRYVNNMQQQQPPPSEPR
ncbi:hypothetical protein Sste5346_002960 [Sporothrix stenoceras]|uniref:Uncharacterized protein n=1 Tax=Sporothrix stenoceras TaxID=5173 RepID=A0ABR3ZFS6_9PEZI